MKALHESQLDQKATAEASSTVLSDQVNTCETLDIPRESHAGSDTSVRFILNIPNVLTIIRLLAVVPLAILISCWPEKRLITVFIFAGIWVTDILDGFIARRFNMMTQFGKLFDPFVDKVFQVVTETAVLKDGAPNFLKAGIAWSSRVTTVSPTYAGEIMTDYFGEGLNDLLTAQSWKVSGILNGIDVDLYNPATDPEIAANYNAKAWIRGKASCKKSLQDELNLPKKQKTPLFSMITRLDSQKGLDLLLHIIDELLEEDLQIVVLGTGDPSYERRLQEVQERHPDNMRAIIQFDRHLARRIYAGSDIFLMPSLFEPCGLSQMIAMRYGTIPVVRQTGGLADTVEPWNKYEKTGTGFGFRNINAHELLYTAKDAAALYRDDKESWSKMVVAAMEGDYTWNRSAGAYQELYAAMAAEVR
jgi:ADP-glucose type glycogen/starch synthase